MSNAYANAMPRRMNSPARYQPAARSFVDISWTTSSLRRIREELHEGVDLARTNRTVVVGGLVPFPEPFAVLAAGLAVRCFVNRAGLALEDLSEVGAGRAVL